MLHNIIIRSGEPTKYDHSPYGTICKSVKGNGNFEIYVQINEDDSSPLWEKVGIFSNATATEHTINDEIERVLNGRKVNPV